MAAYTQDDKQDEYDGTEDDISRIPVFMDFCMYGS